MTTFDDRQQGFEKKYALDEEKSFKIIARRNRLFGLWAAELKGLTGEQADAYAKEVIYADFEEEGDQDVIRKVESDLKKAGVMVTEKDLKVKLHEFYQQARDSLESQA